MIECFPSKHKAPVQALHAFQYGQTSRGSLHDLFLTFSLKIFPLSKFLSFAILYVSYRWKRGKTGMQPGTRNVTRPEESGWNTPIVLCPLSVHLFVGSSWRNSMRRLRSLYYKPVIVRFFTLTRRHSWQLNCRLDPPGMKGRNYNVCITPIPVLF